MKYLIFQPAGEDYQTDKITDSIIKTWNKYHCHIIKYENGKYFMLKEISKDGSYKWEQLKMR